MANVIAFFTAFAALPGAYIASLFGLDGGILGPIATIGVLCLAGGVLLGVIKREKRLMWFLLPVAVSHVFIGVVAAIDGPIRLDLANLTVRMFLLVQVAIVAGLVWRLNGVRLPAFLLAAFALSYAAIAFFIAGMALTGDWL